MGVVDVEPCPVGEDDVGQPDIVVGQLAGICHVAGQGETAGVPQRVLLLVVPSGVRQPRLTRGIPVDDLGRDQDRVHVRVARHGDAVLGLDPHHTPKCHHPSLGAAAQNHSKPSLDD